MKKKIIGSIWKSFALKYLFEEEQKKVQIRIASFIILKVFTEQAQTPVLS